VFDEHVMTPMQKIVGDNLRPEGRGDPQGVAFARVIDEAREYQHLFPLPWPDYAQ
jgi:hypothetical protein